MNFILSFLNVSPYINQPNHLYGWLGWFVFFCLLIWGIYRFWNKDFKAERFSIKWLIFLFLLVPITTFLFGLSFPDQFAAPLPGIPDENNIPVVLLFSAVPWMLAVGMVGPFYALLIALLQGLFRAIWFSHNLFTILETISVAFLFIWMVNQRFRTRIYHSLRKPLFAACVVCVGLFFLTIFSTLCTVQGSIAVRIDYFLTRSWWGMLARWFELLLAGGIVELVRLYKPEFWIKPKPLIPSPSEISIQWKFNRTTIMVGIAFFLSVFIIDWLAAGYMAGRLIENSLESNAKIISQSIPYFLETGQNLAMNLAKMSLFKDSPDKTREQLAVGMRMVPYFRQLFLFDENGEPVTGFPQKNFELIQPTVEEKAAIKLALRGVPVQTYVIHPLPNETSAQVSILAAIANDSGEIKGVLLGRTDFESNPFTQPVIEALESIKEPMKGEGIILDENNRILYHSIHKNLVMTEYVTDPMPSEGMSDNLSEDGTRRSVYVQTIVGRPWKVVLTVPAEIAQMQAIMISIPLIGLLGVIFVFMVVSMWAGLNSITGSMKNLAQESALIAQGDLKRPLKVVGEDEVGQLSEAMEEMRIRLDARMEELNRLLSVSASAASSLQVNNAVQPILQAALTGGVCSARIVLVRDYSFEKIDSNLSCYGTGESSNLYSYLDEQLFEVVRMKGKLVISNTNRYRLFNFAQALGRPGSVFAVPLGKNDEYMGVLWLAHQTPHIYSQEEDRFIETLAGLATLTIANARLFASADIGRQRLEAVINSTPEPVMVFDENLRLLLFNPEAILAGILSNPKAGQHLEEFIPMPELREAIKQGGEGKLISREINLKNGRVYYVLVSPVVSEGRFVGKVCLLQDVTRFKESDSIKSDFVALVSHDLRHPLSLVLGYARMLPVVGEMNEQQKDYNQKIITGLETMGKLVSSLLDLGRVETGIGLQIVKLSMTEVIEKVVAALQPQVVQKNLTIEYLEGMKESFINPLIIEGDADLLRQAVLNLVENAVTFTTMGGKIKLNLINKGDTVFFSVEDTGIGIAPLDLPHVFEKFYRSERQESRKPRGIGLGLAIVKSIVEWHGGRADVDSTLGKGSTFYFEIPKKQTPRLN
jgi:signal transduction histidine kinase/HAMP domain-containing protein